MSVTFVSCEETLCPSVLAVYHTLVKKVMVMFIHVYIFEYVEGIERNSLGQDSGLGATC